MEFILNNVNQQKAAKNEVNRKRAKKERNPKRSEKAQNEFSCFLSRNTNTHVEKTQQAQAHTLGGMVHKIVYLETRETFFITVIIIASLLSAAFS